MREVTLHPSMVVSSHGDGSGHYLVHRDGNTLVTVINGCEALVSSLTRVPQLDDIDLDDFTLTERFASSPDHGGTHGAVWIDGLAYSCEPSDDTVTVVAWELDGSWGTPRYTLDVLKRMGDLPADATEADIAGVPEHVAYYTLTDTERAEVYHFVDEPGWGV